MLSSVAPPPADPLLVTAPVSIGAAATTPAENHGAAVDATLPPPGLIMNFFGNIMKRLSPTKNCPTKNGGETSA